MNHVCRICKLKKHIAPSSVVRCDWKCGPCKQLNRSKESEAKRRKNAHIWRKNKIIQFVMKAKSVPCFDCKKSFPHWLMQFDHRPDTIKLFNIGGNKISKSFAQVSFEISKCDVVCANCHAHRTYCRANGLEVFPLKAGGIS